MLNVVCDTNIYISAFLFGGLPEQILRAGEKGYFNLYISPAIQRETKVILKKKFGWNKSDLDLLIVTFMRLHQIYPTEKLHVLADEPDNRVLECAVGIGTDAIIVSGDREFLKLEKFRNIRLMSPRQFVNDYPLSKAA